MTQLKENGKDEGHNILINRYFLFQLTTNDQDLLLPTEKKEESMEVNSLID